MFEVILFYVLSSALIIGALGVVFSKEPIHSILFLAFSFINAGGLFLSLGAEFNAMFFVVVYLGSVVVLFLFVAMMLGKDADILPKKKKKPFIIVATTLVITIFCELSYLLVGEFVFSKTQSILKPSNKLENLSMSNSKQIGLSLYSDYSLALQITGMILLLAMVGAIMLAILPEKEKNKKQDINSQINTNPKEEITLVKLKAGEGI